MRTMQVQKSVQHSSTSIQGFHLGKISIERYILVSNGFPDLRFATHA